MAGLSHQDLIKQVSAACYGVFDWHVASQLIVLVLQHTARTSSESLHFSVSVHAAGRFSCVLLDITRLTARHMRVIRA